jgi:hypothetical protein
MPNPNVDLETAKRAALLKRGPAYPIPHTKAIFDKFVYNYTVDGQKPKVLELATSQLLIEAKSRLAAIGLNNLSQAGKLSASDHIHVSKPGLIISSAANVKGASAQQVTLPPGMNSYTVPAYPVTDSVIFADELDLCDKTLTIDVNTVSCLWIIARNIKAAHGAVITFSPLTNPNTAPSGVNATPSPADPNFGDDRHSCDDPFQAANGGDGIQGGSGFTGASGLSAPSVFICALNVDAMPDIIVYGQKGGRGGAGGHGGDGGRGQRGRDCHSTWFDCRKGPGYGGNGGRGGDGGKGGQGGKGGNGGCVSFAVPGNQLEVMLTTKKFTLNNSGGEGGDPGAQGEPGNGGAGGNAGYAYDRCSDAPERAGHSGMPGQKTGDLGRGSAGSTGDIGFVMITEDQFMQQLDQPWIMAAEPSTGYPGDAITIRGLNFTSTMKVEMIREGSNTSVPLSAIFVSDQEVRTNIPNTALAAHMAIRLTSTNQNTQNTVPLTIKPLLQGIAFDDQAVKSFYAGQTIQLTGLGFPPGSIVSMDGKTIIPLDVSPQKIKINIPDIIGEDPGGNTTFVITTSDVLSSNPIVILRQPVVDNGFRPSKNGFAFRNFEKGQNVGLDTYQATFGAEEVVLESLLDPLTSAAYYEFFHYFLTNFGHCTGFSTLALDRYHHHMPTYSEGPNTNADPPAISNELMHQINVAQGRTISRESIYYYADQSKHGVDRVETSVREIETNLKQGFGTAGNALVLSFIPSGSVWDMITDPKIRDALTRGHCVAPYRIVYPDRSRNLDGAKLYIYNCNNEGDDTQYIPLYKKDGKVTFSYGEYSPENGFTLGTAPLQKELYDDVDVPFAELEMGEATVAFILEFILSPAYVSIKDTQNRVLGYRDGKVYACPELGWIRPGFENYFMVRPDAKIAERLITGVATGTYHYGSVRPGNRSVILSHIPCTANTRDRLLIKADLTEVQFQPSEPKPTNLHICAPSSDGGSRALSVETALKANECLIMNCQPDLSQIQFHAPAVRPLKVTTRMARAGRVVYENTKIYKPKNNGKLILPQDVWPVDLPVQAEPAIYSKGQVTIRGTWSCDLDKGIEGDKSVDFFWEQETSTIRHLVPRNGAKFTIVGKGDLNSVTYQELTGLTYSANKIDGSNSSSNQLLPGTILAVRTNEGRYCKFRIDNYGYNLTLSWITYYK